MVYILTRACAKVKNRLSGFIASIDPIVFYIALIVFLYSFLMLMGYFNRPISDDYHFSQLSAHGTPFHLAIEGYMNGNGRLGQYFVFGFYDALFGLNKAVMIAPVVNTIVLAAALCILVFILLKKCSISKEGLMRNSAVIGLLAAIIMIYSARSIFDSSLWLDSSVSYIPSLIFFVLSTIIFLKIYLAQSSITFKKIILLFIVVLIGQQFSEPTAVIVIASFALGSMYFLLKKNYKMCITSIAGLTSSILGLLVIYLSPGSQARRINYQSTLDINAMFIESTRYFQYAFDIMFSWRFALYLALGAIICYSLRKMMISYRRLIVGAGLCLVLILLPYYLLFIVSEYSLPGYIALRTYQVPAALAGVGLSGIIAIVLYVVLRLIPAKYAYKWVIVACISSIAAFSFAYKPLAIVVKAEALRSVQYDYREQSIKEQVIAGAKTIYVFPAPILLSDAEPGEFLYRDSGQIDWYTESFKKYYNIENKNLEIKNQQLMPYCLPNQALPSWNIKSCETLR